MGAVGAVVIDWTLFTFHMSAVGMWPCRGSLIISIHNHSAVGDTSDNGLHRDGTELVGARPFQSPREEVRCAEAETGLRFGSRALPVATRAGKDLISSNNF